MPINDLYINHKGKYTSHVTHMPEVNKSKQSNGFATEGKSRKTQNQMTTGSSLQNNDPHSNTMPHGSLANRIGHVPAIVTATATS